MKKKKYERGVKLNNEKYYKKEKNLIKIFHSLKYARISTNLLKKLFNYKKKLIFWENFIGFSSSRDFYTKKYRCDQLC